MAIVLLLINPAIFLQLLDILQIIRFILFVNVQYPKLVEAFFEIFSIFDFNFLPDFMSIIVPNILE